ncbi:MAG: sterol desaturase family protein [Bacteroidetes bacterium]|nr:sterol desaturase family protein [Bacteroidota bacterium]
MWNDIIAHFEGLENRPLERLAFIVGGLLIFWIIEGAIPLLPMHYKKNKARHAGVNLLFTLIHLIIHTGFGIVIVLLADWCAKANFGLIYWAGLAKSTGLVVILSALMLDLFGGWMSHFIEHKVPLFWRWHIVHHADNNVDVTTGLRHHPLESVWRGVFFLIGLVLCGAPVYGVMIYQTFLTIFTSFTHANISLPPVLDKLISYVLVSPNMHKVHHHWKQPYTDSNYGAVFAIWDRIFFTFKTMNPKDIRYGLDRYYPNEQDENLGALLKRPFEPLK